MPPNPEEKYQNMTPSSSDDSCCNVHLLHSTHDQVPVNRAPDDNPDFAMRSMLKHNQQTVFTILKLCKSHEELLESCELWSNYVFVLNLLAN